MAHTWEPLSQMPVTKFKGQDFKTLRDRCLSRGHLFEDETFPAEISSIGPLLLQGKHLSSLRWERPKVSEPPGTHPAPGPSEPARHGPSHGPSGPLSSNPALTLSTSLDDLCLGILT